MTVIGQYDNPFPSPRLRGEGAPDLIRGVYPIRHRPLIRPLGTFSPLCGEKDIKNTER